MSAPDGDGDAKPENIVYPPGGQCRDPILVTAGGPKIGILRRELRTEEQSVSFADTAGAGGNPARIMAAWLEFARIMPELAAMRDRRPGTSRPFPG